MLKKQLIISIIVGLTLTTTLPLFGQIEVGGDFVTDYVWRGGNALSGAPAVQPSITATMGESGLAINAWSSFALTNRDHISITDLDELDLTLSYDRQISNLGLFAGFIHYNTVGGASTYEVYLGCGVSEMIFSPALTIYYDGDEAMYMSLSGSKTLEFDDGPAIDESISIGFLNNSTTDAGISDINYSISTTIPFCVGSLTPSFTFTYTPDDQINPDYFIFWGGLGIYWAQ